MIKKGSGARGHTLYLISPRGWCAGVERAIGIVDAALKHRSRPIYVRREIVHNKTVVEHYFQEGVVFVDEVDEVPNGQTVIFSAHGIAPEVERHAQNRNLNIIDATCPLVTKVHLEVNRYINEGYSILYVGHRNHEEAIGVLGEAPEKIQIIETESEAREAALPKGKTVVLTQTTLSIDDTKRIILALQDRLPDLEFPPKEDICYATTNRQNAVKKLIEQTRVSLFYVIGSQNSSNSNRLRELSESLGVPSRLIDSVNDIKESDWKNETALGLTAGASAPEALVQEVAAYFRSRAWRVQEISFEQENVTFALPKELIALTEERRKAFA
ncbi:MAG: 4-hydroxy-3-methylbut-2-enyl diphosphate reductase [Elusimicrobia bacterium]|nr:4-hydroxy-3-methylbut-2-enyl diphosphate reductase [Elusimicrobiota bacterium]